MHDGAMDCAPVSDLHSKALQGGLLVIVCPPDVNVDLVPVVGLIP